MRLLLAVVLLALPLPAVAQTAEGDRLTILPDEDTIVTVEGHHPRIPGLCEAKQPKPMRAKYRGRLDVVLAADGSLRLINSLSFDHYLRGLAEVPLSWPRAALRAQIIAARSYALHAYQRDRDASRRRGYDICSTDQCQVYRGATVELGAFGERWVDAVRDTRGRVLTYRGRVIQAFYFSTSDGRTRRSFPGGTPQPWLPSVSGEDEDAPLARWTARFPLRHLARILDRSGDWPGGTIRSVRRDGDVLVLRGARTARVPLSRFRIAMNNEAPCTYPARYPSKTGSAIRAALPQTIPSTSFSLRLEDGTLILRGRGWGHGIGMSQWGARSLADRGRSAAQILDHYYGPARLERVREPGRIRVLAAEKMRLIRLSIEGPVRIRTATGSVLQPGSRFEIRGGDTLRIRRGRGPSLRPVLTMEPTVRTLTADPGDTVSVPFEASRAVRVHAEIRRDDVVVLTTKERSVERGSGAVEVGIRSEDDTPLAAGSYQVVLEAYDGLDRIRTRPVALTITGPSPTPTRRAAAPPAGGPSTPILVLALLALLAAGGLAVRSWRLSRR